MWFSPRKATASKSSLCLNNNWLSLNYVNLSDHMKFHVKLPCPPPEAAVLTLYTSVHIVPREASVPREAAVRITFKQGLPQGYKRFVVVA